MADTKASAFTPDASPTMDDGVPLINDLSGTPSNTIATLGDVAAAIKLDDLGTPDDNTDLDATTSYHGLLPKLSGDSATFLNGLGSFATPSVGASDSVQKTVYNSTGATILKGKAVHINGWKTGNEVPTVALARSDSATTMPALGLVLSDISNNSEGTIVVVGSISGLDTSGYTLDDPLYVDPSTAGDLTTTKPVGANLIQAVARVTRVNASNGTVFVAGALRSNDVPNFSAADKFWYGGTSGVSTEGDITAFARSILDDADEATFKATVNLEIGTDVQAYDANLSTIAGLTPGTEDTLITSDGLGDWTVKTAANFKTDNSILDTSATLDSLSGVDTDKSKTPADGDVLTFDGTDWNAETPAAGGGGGIPDVTIAASGGDSTTVGGATISAGDFVYIKDDTTETGNVTVSASNITILAAREALVGLSTNYINFTGSNVHIMALNLDATTGDIFFGSGGGGDKFLVNNLVHTCSSTSRINIAGSDSLYTNMQIYDSSAANTQNVQVTGSRNTIKGGYFDIPARNTSTGNIELGGNTNTLEGVFINNDGDNAANGNAVYTSGLFNRVINCVIDTDTSAATTAIYVAGDHSIISGNTIDEGKYGIEINGGDTCVITNNVIEGCSDQAIFNNSASSNFNTISANTISGGVDGIYVQQSDHVTISGNTIENCTDGVHISSSASDKVVVVGNSLASNTTALNDLGTGTVTSGNSS